MRGSRLLAAALAVALLLAPTAALAAEREGLVYTAIGDSIAAGTGGTGSVGYVEGLRDHLARRYGDVTLYEMSHDGMTSGMLRTYLTNPGSPYHAALIAAVADADVITVSIGGNDLLQPVLGLVAAHPEYRDPAYLESLPPAERAALLASLDALLRPYVTQFAGNWPVIIGRIRMANPTARVCVNALYNPFRPGDGLYGIVDPYVRALNDVIAGYAENPVLRYAVIDVYTRFAEYGNPVKPAVWAIPEIYALHPTDVGYKFILNLHKAALSGE